MSSSVDSAIASNSETSGETLESNLAQDLFDDDDEDDDSGAEEMSEASESKSAEMLPSKRAKAELARIIQEEGLSSQKASLSDGVLPVLPSVLGCSN